MSPSEEVPLIDGPEKSSVLLIRPILESPKSVNCNKEEKRFLSGNMQKQLERFSGSLKRDKKKYIYTNKNACTWRRDVGH